MPRRAGVPKRDVLPDPKFNSKVVTKLINQVMYDGKKSTAEGIVYGAFDIVEKKLNQPAIDVFTKALENVMPAVEVKARRVGGSTYQVPLDIRADRRQTLGIRWMTFLPDGSCCMSVEWDGWNGILTGTAEGTQGRTEDGTELYFTLTDQNGRPCEFWAILLNDDGSPSGCSLKYRAGEVLFDRDTRPIYWKNDSPELTLEP